MLAQTDSLPEPERRGGRGDGSGGGRGDGSGGGRLQQESIAIPANPTTVRAQPSPVARGNGATARPRFAGLYMEHWVNHDLARPELGQPAPLQLVTAYEGSTTPADRLRSASLLVDTLLVTGTAEELYTWADTLMRHAERLNDPELRARAHFARGTALVREGRYKRAFEDLRAALLLCEEQRDAQLIAQIHARIGDGLMAMGGQMGALQRYREVLRIAASNSIAPRLRSHALLSIGDIHAQLEEPDSARASFRQAIKEARDMGLHASESRGHMGLGSIARAFDEHAAAAIHYADAIRALDAHPNNRLMMDARLAMGEAYLADDKRTEAINELAIAARSADSLGAHFTAAKARIFMASAMRDRKQQEQLLREAESIGRMHDLGIIRKEVLLTRADLLIADGRAQEANPLIMHAMALADTLSMQFFAEGARLQMQRSMVGLKDREIDELEQQRAEQRLLAELQQERITSQRDLIIGAAIALLVVALLAINARRAYRAQRRLSEDLAATHAEVLVQKKRAEESERAKDRFLANMSHEIRTPLNAIIGFTSLLLEDKQDDRSKRFLSAIRDAGDNLMVVINDVLDLGRMEAGRLALVREAFDLHRCVRNCGEILAHRAAEQRDTLTIDIQAGTPQWVMGDGARLSQILINLAGNALKFTTDGEVRLELKAADDGVQFRISDNGIGIPKEKLTSVFERFTQVDANDQRRYGGTGLGLAIVKELVALHQGKLHVESEVGKGTTFTVTLPLEQAKGPTTTASPIARSNSFGSLKGRTILIAEDNDLNATVAIETLKRRYPGSELVRVTTGRQALEQVLTNTNRIGIVLMDVQMPELDGMEATRAIRSRGSRIPIVALTASVLPADLSKCIEAGMDACVPKPFKVSELVDAIERLTGDGGIELNASERDDSTLYAELFEQLMPERLDALRIAQAAGDRSAIQRAVHVMRPQLVHHDQARFANACDELLVMHPDAPEQAWNEKVNELIEAIAGQLA